MLALLAATEVAFADLGGSSGRVVGIGRVVEVQVEECDQSCGRSTVRMPAYGSSTDTNLGDEKEGDINIHEIS